MSGSDTNVSSSQAVGFVGPAPRFGDYDTFSGGNRVKQWLFQYTNYCNLRALSEPCWSNDGYRMVYAITRLRGSASDWWQSVMEKHNFNPYPTFADWANALSAACLSVDNVRVQRQRLASLSQGSRSVAEYIRQFRLIAMGIPNFQYDGEGLARFLEHLDSNIRLQVDLKNPQTLQEAMEVAQAAAAVLEARPNRSNRFAQLNASPYEYAPPPPRYSPQQQQQPQPMELGMLVCKRCHQPGHKASFCPTLRCTNCGRFGHSFSVCVKPKSHPPGPGGAPRKPPPNVRAH